MNSSSFWHEERAGKDWLGVENLKSRQRQQQSGIGVGMSLQPLALITEGIFHEKTIIEYE